MQFFKKEGEEGKEDGLEYLIFKCPYWLKKQKGLEIFLTENRECIVECLPSFKLDDFCNYNYYHKPWSK